MVVYLGLHDVCQVILKFTSGWRGFFCNAGDYLSRASYSPLPTTTGA